MDVVSNNSFAAIASAEIDEAIQILAKGPLLQEARDEAFVSAARRLQPALMEALFANGPISKEAEDWAVSLVADYYTFIAKELRDKNELIARCRKLFSKMLLPKN